MSLLSKIAEYKILADALATFSLNHDVSHLSINDLRCLVHNIYHEAPHEPAKGQAAVAHVTLYRVISPEFPNNICDVVYQTTRSKIGNRVLGQFSWTHKNWTVDLTKISTIKFTSNPAEPESDVKKIRTFDGNMKERYRRITNVALKVYVGEKRGVDNCAKFYYNPYIVNAYFARYKVSITTGTTKKVRGRKLKGMIGNHRFMFHPRDKCKKTYDIKRIEAKGAFKDPSYQAIFTTWYVNDYGVYINKQEARGPNAKQASASGG